jgi:chromosomal replication initiation ATPase DnaA
MYATSYWAAPSVGVAQKTRTEEDNYQALLRAIMYHFDVTEDDLLRQDKTRELVQARSILIYFAFTNKIFAVMMDLARRVDRNQKTVYHAVQKISNFIDIEDDDTIHDLNMIKMLYNDEQRRYN